MFHLPMVRDSPWLILLYVEKTSGVWPLPFEITYVIGTEVREGEVYTGQDYYSSQG